MSERTAEIERRTGETSVSLRLALDGGGAGTRATGVGFLDHMLDLLARHGEEVNVSPRDFNDGAQLAEYIARQSARGRKIDHLPGRGGGVHV